MEQPLGAETSKNKPFPDLNRNDILKVLWADIQWLRKKARNHNPIRNPVRVSLIRASIYACSVLLNGLKDDELERRIEELEETIRGGVVIPNEQKTR